MVAGPGSGVEQDQCRHQYRRDPPGEQVDDRGRRGRGSDGEQSESGEDDDGDQGRGGQCHRGVAVRDESGAAEEDEGGRDVHGKPVSAGRRRPPDDAESEQTRGFNGRGPVIPVKPECGRCQEQAAGDHEHESQPDLVPPPGDPQTEGAGQADKYRTDPGLDPLQAEDGHPDVREEPEYGDGEQRRCHRPVR